MKADSTFTPKVIRVNAHWCQGLSHRCQLGLRSSNQLPPQKHEEGINGFNSSIFVDYCMFIELFVRHDCPDEVRSPDGVDITGDSFAPGPSSDRILSVPARHLVLCVDGIGSSRLTCEFGHRRGKSVKAADSFISMSGLGFAGSTASKLRVLPSKPTAFLMLSSFFPAARISSYFPYFIEIGFRVRGNLKESVQLLAGIVMTVRAVFHLFFLAAASDLANGAMTEESSRL
jgi:hypothetical protein